MIIALWISVACADAPPPAALLARALERSASEVVALEVEERVKSDAGERLSRYRREAQGRWCRAAPGGRACDETPAMAPDAYADLAGTVTDPVLLEAEGCRFVFGFAPRAKGAFVVAGEEGLQGTLVLDAERQFVERVTLRVENPRRVALGLYRLKALDAEWQFEAAAGEAALPMLTAYRMAISLRMGLATHEGGVTVVHWPVASSHSPFAREALSP